MEENELLEEAILCLSDSSDLEKVKFYEKKIIEYTLLQHKMREKICFIQSNCEHIFSFAYSIGDRDTVYRCVKCNCTIIR